MIDRVAHLAEVSRLLSSFPVVGIIGARQVGKTTLAHQLSTRFEERTFLDLEDPSAVARLSSPKLALEPLRGLVVLDEVQRVPELFRVLRVLADRPGLPARFLVLGSASPELLRQASESLAGRIAYHELQGFDLEEVGTEDLSRRWFRGGFPRAYLARDEETGWRWRGELIRTYLERDLALHGFRLVPEVLRWFWTMAAHYHGQTWNGSELARALAVSEGTVRHYLDVLRSTFMLRRLEPWHANLGKRLVKSPKVYLTDSGVLHRLLGIRDRAELLEHPKAGASWEGLVVESVVRRLRAGPDECFFWGVHTGAELDLLVVRGRQRLGFEAKLTDAPRVTPSMRSALETLELERLDVVHAGRDTSPLADRIRALSLSRLLLDLAPLARPS